MGKPAARTAMPTLAPGRAEPMRQHGYTLLEVLIVLAIIGIATAAVSVQAFPPSEKRALETDARRLAQWFAVAHGQARHFGQTVHWSYHDAGYRFVAAPDSALTMPLAAMRTGPEPALFQAHSWASTPPVKVRVHPAGDTPFTGEWFSGPTAVELHSGDRVVRIVRSGAGQYRVVP